MSNRKGEVWMEFRANIPLILEKLDQGWPASHIWRFLKAEWKFTGSERHFWLLIVTHLNDEYKKSRTIQTNEDVNTNEKRNKRKNKPKKYDKDKDPLMKTFEWSAEPDDDLI